MTFHLTTDFFLLHFVPAKEIYYFVVRLIKWFAKSIHKPQSFAKLLYVALRFSNINLTEKKLSGIQGVTCQFSKNQNPGQSCRPSISLMAGNPTIHNAWFSDSIWCKNKNDVPWTRVRGSLKKSLWWYLFML